MEFKRKNNDSLLELLKANNPDKETLRIVNRLQQEYVNPILLDAPFQVANKEDCEEIMFQKTVLYKGSPYVKPLGKAVFDICGGYHVEPIPNESLFTDKSLKFLHLENQSVDCISDGLFYTIFYGNRVGTLKEFNGFSQYYSGLTSSVYDINHEGSTANPVLDAGGKGNDNRDIWMVKWGLNQVHMIYPKETELGLERIYQKTDAGLNLGFSWVTGLVIRELGCVARICNIDRNMIESDHVDIGMLVQKGCYRLNHVNEFTAIYSDKETLRLTKNQDKKKKQNGERNSVLEEKDVYSSGEKITTYGGLPWHGCNVLDIDVARVV